MIRSCILKHTGELIYDTPIEEAVKEDSKWCWVDFSSPDELESGLLSSVFNFHPLAIEDCLDGLKQRPKLDFYNKYIFVVVHGLNQTTLEANEIDLFVSEKIIVTIHKQPVRELNNLWDQIKNDKGLQAGPFNIMHAIIDRVVDDYFPPLYRIEGELNSIEDNSIKQPLSELMENLFDVRSEISQIRRTILPMRDLLYRIIHSERFNQMHESQHYFNDVHDHLLKLVEMLESNRDFSSDLRDSYISLNSNNMNTIMATLTIITTIFMPLTFIAGVYGMNFSYMPELEWRYGYFMILLFMGVIAIGMFYVFKRKGWLRVGFRRTRKKE